MKLPEGMAARLAADHPYPRAFLTVSGAHLYGFPSADSDIDLRGVHLMRTGEVEADLTRLAGDGPPYLPELIEAKRAAEHGALPQDAPGLPRLQEDVAALTVRLEAERESSDLPEFPAGRRALHDLVVRTRLR